MRTLDVYTVFQFFFTLIISTFQKILFFLYSYSDDLKNIKIKCIVHVCVAFLLVNDSLGCDKLLNSPREECKCWYKKLHFFSYEWILTVINNIGEFCYVIFYHPENSFRYEIRTKFNFNLKVFSYCD